MTMRKKISKAMTVFALSWLAGSAQAGVVISGTRVIYQAKEREVTVKLSNEGDAPALVQVWLDTGNPNALPDESKVPFTLSPPLFRLDPKKGQSLRLIYTQEPLPQDKESLFWLNVLEVPPRATTGTTADQPNSLQLAFRSRIKLFFRPAGLPGNADDAAAQVRWKFVRKDNGAYALEATNPTPYHVTFSKIVATEGASNWTSEKGGMVDPGASADFDVGRVAPLAEVPAQVDYTFLNDYGAGVGGKRLRDQTGQ
ncbi:fimbria/pilus periplasmic chaperone [Paraburkholderia sp. BCC1876]|uniref:fimbrial biogenesis chaperone n=1 Tax=Paraburkholderia sp. BCC1876 TaxID=2676303 RepID=UPI00159256DF|nr:fimbria/pilus periplasmic chaperone [Paraburkholderia sp. BCC1876]